MLKVMLIIALLLAATYTVHAEEPPRILDNRLAGWHRTMVVTNETAPNSGVFTYLTNQRTATLSNVLVKYVPSIEVDGKWLGPTHAEAMSVEDFPGGVTANFRLGEVHVTTEIVPLFFGRGTMACEGAALYTITTDPPTPVRVGIGGPDEQTMFVTPGIQRDELAALEELAVDGGPRARFVSGRERLHAGLAVSGTLAAHAVDGGQALMATFQEGQGTVLLAYGDDAARVNQLLYLDRKAHRAEIDAYYDELLKNAIDTPEPALNQAFRSALYNLEYNWNEPYGWNECIHHWLAIWHNQHTAGAEWIGQEDRSRLCTVTHAENLLPSGAVPQFTMDGSTRRDFGGSNHFWAWQARHYWRFTQDKEFARAVAPALDTVIEQTLEEHDPDGNLLVAWGLQIGNQEDFIQFYHDGGTPSIELINMMLTRAELAEGLGDTDTAVKWRGLAGRARSNLMKALWLGGLGRLGNYVDEHGKIRLDAQYHTFLYPVIWDLVDEYDGYTTLRHVHDTLTGEGGEVYCSNNFPNHANGTWGMQAGAAQQPWAAWAYSKAGQRNETYRPLLAIAREVMNKNLRGAWPEVMLEHSPAYFSPPVGLFIASVTESLFGLYVDKPAGVLRVSPSFPDEWPGATINLARYGAEYQRLDDGVSYKVRSDEPMARALRWSLPPATDIRIWANGKLLKHTETPGVQRIIVEALAPAATETTFEIRYNPIDYAVSHTRAVAEAANLEASVKGAKVVGVVDRLGVLDAIAFDGSSVQATVRTGLLAPYLPYGRLGQVTFSRRTVFLECQAGEARFSVPLDFTVLPRYEVAPAGELAENGKGLRAAFLIRGNVEEKVSGLAWLHVARHEIPFDLSLRGRGEKTVEVTIPAPAAALLSVGDNDASVVLPNGTALPIMLTLAAPPEPLGKYYAERLVNIPLPEDDLSPYTDWAKLREGSHGGPVPWPGWTQPLQGIEQQSVFECGELPGVRFEVTPGKWVIVGERAAAPYYRLDVPGGYYRKFYLLLATFADNHDMYTKLGDITVRGKHGVLRGRPLYLPGDVDWWEPNGMVKTMDTARYPRENRFGLLPMLGDGAWDWRETTPLDVPERDGLLLGRQRKVQGAFVPPSLPQPEYWSTSRVIRTPNCIFNVVEVDLGKPREVSSIALGTLGVCPGFAIYGVVAERTGGTEHLEGTPWMPEGRFREPKVLFDLANEGDVEDWELDGASYSEVFNIPTLNTLKPGGEAATGRALSPVYVLPEDAGQLLVELQGGNNVVDSGEDTLVLRVLDAETGAVLAKLAPPGSHVLTEAAIPLKGHGGKRIRIELLDNNTNASYAWIGIKKASVEAE